MKFFICLCLFAMFLAQAQARVSCLGEGISGKRGKPGTELVIDGPLNGGQSHTDCYSLCRGRCQRNEGSWNGCMSFDMEHWSDDLRSGCKCYGYSEQEPPLVNGNTGNYFVHYKCTQEKA